MLQHWQKVNSLPSFNHVFLNIYIVQNNTNQMSEKWMTNFCSLKKWTLQTVGVSKSGHYKLLESQKADNTKFCSLKKRTLQTFVVSKSGHYKLLWSQKADPTYLCRLKKWTLVVFCSLSVKFVVLSNFCGLL
jgi:hypothetical protein